MLLRGQLAAAPPRQGLWWDPSRPGSAVELLPEGEGVTVIVHDHDRDGTTRWTQHTGALDGGTFTEGGDPAGGPVLRIAFAGADAYVQTVIRDDLVKLIPFPRLQDILDYHSSVTDAAQTAARAGVGTLVLTHYVPAPAPDSLHEWVAIAAEHFAGPIVAGDDLTTVTVP